MGPVGDFLGSKFGMLVNIGVLSRETPMHK